LTVIEVGMATAEAVQKEPPAEVGQFHRLEKPLSRRKAAEDPEILPMVRAGFEVGGHGFLI
jgi:hypothetical protein